jgi:serine/threonine-protein kinase
VALGPSVRVGPYEVTAKIGSGGMGEVWRASDTNLGRDVAIKVLPDAFAQDAERLARFEREAKTLAALNHPNIAAIYGLEKSDGTRALVMELVEGPTLADRVARGALPVDEALPIARQIADALEAAHEQGIIHRDLKPANIKVREDGTVKVLDFGLAKAFAPENANASPGDLSHSPTITSPAMTQAGMILGTAAYMSPEQARGKAVDKRADIWAFGCVLYEMLTGRRAFGGDDVTDTLANVLKTDPDWTCLPSEVSSRVRNVLKRCLTKDHSRRIPGIAAVRFLIDELDEPESPTAQTRARTTHRTMYLALAVGVTTAILGAAATWAIARRISESPETSPVIRLTVGQSATTARLMRSFYRGLAISRDGARVVYGGASASVPMPLMLRVLDRFDETALAGTEGARFPFFSPDGTWIAFVNPNDELRKVPAAGGPTTPLARLNGSVSGATWGPGGIVVSAGRERGLYQVPAAGGEPTVLAAPDASAGETDYDVPEALPNGRGILFAAGTEAGSRIAVLELPSRRVRTVAPSGTSPKYFEVPDSPLGFLVYADGSTVRAVRFDADALETVGPTESVLENVATIGRSSQFAVSHQGLLVYISGSIGILRRLAWIGRTGDEEPIDAPVRSYAFLRLSPDEQRVALDVRDGVSRLWIWDVARRSLEPLTAGPTDTHPIWSPDGRSVVYTSGPTTGRRLLRQLADGTGQPQVLMAASTDLAAPTSFVPDGTTVIVQAGNNIGAVGPDTKGRADELLSQPFAERNGEVSPDGRWLAYESNESGRFEIYVRPFPDVDGPRTMVSAAGGRQPSWNRSGGELFYVALDGALMAVPLRTSPTLSRGTPRKLFDLAPPPTNPARIYDATRDGRRFVVLKDADVSAQLSVVVNWGQEVRAVLGPP